MKLEKPVYLDYSSTTPLDPRVLEKMLPYFTSQFGNPSSQLHQWGWKTQAAVSKARSQVASLLNCRPDEITFTSGTTESVNWLIQRMADTTEGPGHFITSNVEHSCVRKVFQFLERKGHEVTWVKADSKGRISSSDVIEAIKSHTRLVSLIWVQNEIGTVQPIEEVAQVCAEKKVYFHVDAAQAVGRLEIDLAKTPATFLSFSAHKIYGPQGNGILFHRKVNPKTNLEPLFFGGGQESGLRSSSHNVPGIVGLGEACALTQVTENRRHLLAMKNKLWSLLSDLPTPVRRNGDPDHCSPQTLHVTFPELKIEKLMPYLSQLGISQGAACGGFSTEMSPVLQAIGLTNAEAQRSFRFSVGLPTTQEELEQTVKFLDQAIRQ